MIRSHVFWFQVYISIHLYIVNFDVLRLSRVKPSTFIPLLHFTCLCDKESSDHFHCIYKEMYTAKVRNVYSESGGYRLLLHKHVKLRRRVKVEGLTLLDINTSKLSNSNE